MQQWTQSMGFSRQTGLSVPESTGYQSTGRCTLRWRQMPRRIGLFSSGVVINIFVQIIVYFIYLEFVTVLLSSILFYFTTLTLELLGVSYVKHLFPSALGVVGSEAILFVNDEHITWWKEKIRLLIEQKLKRNRRLMPGLIVDV